MHPRPPQSQSLTGETYLISRALAGDIHAVDKLLQYLGSNNPNLRKIMLNSIRKFNEPALYEHLLRCLAQGKWEVQLANGQTLACSRHSEPNHAERIDASIIELFSLTSDKPQAERMVAVLKHATQSTQSKLRFAAGCLLAYRGDASVIPILEDVIERGSLPWKIRAVHALAGLDDPHAGLPLIIALSMASADLHAEARRALSDLGEKAQTAWISALKHSDSHIRWHAARGLGEVGDDQAIEILAAGLMDDNHAVRWATARVLARLDAAAVPAILTVISCNPLTEPFRQAAIHALHAMNSRHTQTRIEPLLTVLKNPAANVRAPGLAQSMLSTWQRRAPRRKAAEKLW